MIFIIVPKFGGVECGVLKHDHGLVTRILFKRLAPKLGTYMDSLSRLSNHATGLDLKPRFSLSTLLLALTFAAISIGWYLDHKNGGRPTESYLERQLNLAVSKQTGPNEIEFAVGIAPERFGNLIYGLKHEESLIPDPQFPNMRFPIIGGTRKVDALAYAIWPIIELHTEPSTRYIGICWPKDKSGSYVFRAIYIDPFLLK